MSYDEAIRDLLEGSRTIGFNSKLARAVGGPLAGLFLQQLMFWSQFSEDGWVFRTQDELEEETALTRRNQETARTQLKKLDLIEEKYEGIPRRLHYRVLWPNLRPALKSCDSAIQGCSVPPYKDGGFVHANNEREYEKSKLVEDSLHSSSVGTGKKQREENKKSRKLTALTKAEAEQEWERLVNQSVHGDNLLHFGQMIAEQNETGKVETSRLWREVGKRFEIAYERESLSDAAWSYGFEQAISRNVPNVGYALKAAKNYRGSDQATQPEEEEPEEWFPPMPEPLTEEEEAASLISELRSRAGAWEKSLSPWDEERLKIRGVTISDVWPGEEHLVRTWHD